MMRIHPAKVRAIFRRNARRGVVPSVANSDRPWPPDSIRTSWPISSSTLNGQAEPFFDGDMA